MTAPTLTTQLDRETPDAKARFAHNQGLAEELRSTVAAAALGGPEKHRDRHVSRGKLLPRDRVERLLDPGSPFLEVGQLAANGMYEGDVNGASMIAGIGRVILSDDRQKAPARAGDCAGEPTAVHLPRR